MKLWSDSWANGERIPERYGCGRIDPAGGVTFSDNLNPHLAWSDLPKGTRSLVLICHDFDVPSRGDDVNQAGREIAADLPRIDFFHWLLVDIPASANAIAKARSAAASRRAARPARRSTCRASPARATASTTTPPGSRATPT